MDCRAAARWTLVVGGAFAAGMIAAYGWSKTQAARERDKLGGD